MPDIFFTVRLSIKAYILLNCDRCEETATLLQAGDNGFVVGNTAGDDDLVDPAVQGACHGTDILGNLEDKCSSEQIRIFAAVLYHLFHFAFRIKFLIKKYHLSAEKSRYSEPVQKFMIKK